MNKIKIETFYSVSFCQPGTPCFHSMWAHIECKNADEQDRIISFIRFQYPTLKIFHRELTAESAREEIPFIHSVRNSESAKIDRFFRVRKWSTGAQPVGAPREPFFEELEALEFLKKFSAKTGHPPVPVADLYIRPGAVEAISSFARRGGSSKSQAKAAAARRNGRKGGRPPNASKGSKTNS